MQARRFPPELLVQIFGLIEFNSHMAWDPKYRPFTPQFLIYPLLFVCKEWYEVARPLLDSSVSLGNDRVSGCGGGRWSLVYGAEDICASLYESFQKNPHLSPLVRELRLGSYYVSEDRTESYLHAQILLACKDVERVEIAGFTCRYLDYLRYALFETNLVELSISRTGLGGWSTRALQMDTSFCSPSEIISFILRCPHITKVKLEDALSWSDDERLLPDASSVDNCCPNLREIIFRGSAISSSQLELLTKAAQNVEKAMITIRGGGAGSSQSCLRRWSSTLSDFLLHSGWPPSVAAAKVNSKLPELRSLTVKSINVPPDLLAEFSLFETVTYSCTMEHLERLARKMRDSQFLPRLRMFHIRRDPSAGAWRGDNGQSLSHLSAIRDVCRARDVRYEFRINRIVICSCCGKEA